MGAAWKANVRCGGDESTAGTDWGGVCTAWAKLAEEGGCMYLRGCMDGRPWLQEIKAGKSVLFSMVSTLLSGDCDWWKV